MPIRLGNGLRITDPTALGGVDSEPPIVDPPTEPPPDTGTDPVIDYPPGTKTGDLLFLWVVTRYNAVGEPNVPSNWTLVYKKATGGGNRPYGALYERVVGAERSVAITGSVTGRAHIIRTHGYRKPSDSNRQYTLASGGTVDPADVYAVSSGVALVFMAMDQEEAGTSPPSGYTELTNQTASTLTIASAYKEITSAATENPGAWTHSGPDHYIAVTLFLPLKTVSPPAGLSTYFDLVSLLHMNGADTSTTISDDGPTKATGTALGNAQIDTDQSKFGGASLLGDGSGDSVKFTFHHLLSNIDERPFTIAFWWRPTSVAAQRDLVGKWNDTTITGELSWLFAYVPGSSGFVWNYTTNGTSSAGTLTWAYAPVVDTWQHVALVRNFDGDAQVAVDGTWIGTAQAMGTPFQSNAPLRFGGRQDAATGNELYGHMDEVIFDGRNPYWTLGVDFTPPTSAYPNL